tara:strand:+ start:148 stop:369 length:222 start_codon:yes stop_codon:yes gene_type:complete
MTDNILDIPHSPTVKGIIARLARTQDDIVSITAIIQWEGKRYDIVYDTKDISDLCYESKLLETYLSGQLSGEE